MRADRGIGNFPLLTGFQTENLSGIDKITSCINGNGWKIRLKRAIIEWIFLIMRIRSQALLESVPGAARRLFVLRKFALPAFPFNWHYHAEIELTLINKGSGVRYVGQSIERYRAGDLCLLGANLPHSWSSSPRDGAVDSIVIQFLPDYWKRDLGNLVEFLSLGTLLRKARQGFSIEGRARDRVANLMHEMEKLPPDSWRRGTLFLEVLGILAEQTRLRTLNPISSPLRMNGRHGQPLARVLKYVQVHFAAEIAHAEVARLVRLSPPAFCRFFKRQMGKTFSDYVNEVRLINACNELVDTEASITEIAFACGYNNLAHFNRRFRSLLACTPRDYRRLASSV